MSTDIVQFIKTINNYCDRRCTHLTHITYCQTDIICVPMCNTINEFFAFCKSNNIQITAEHSIIINKALNSIFRTSVFGLSYTCRNQINNKLLQSTIECTINTITLNLQNIFNILQTQDVTIKSFFMELPCNQILFLQRSDYVRLLRLNLSPKYLMKFIKLISKNANQLLLVCQYFPDYIDVMKTNEINIPMSCVAAICNNDQLSGEKIIQIIKKYNGSNNYNINCLENASITCNVELILFLLDHRLIPNKRCFDAILESKSLKNNIKKCIDIYIGCDYKLTKQDILKCLKSEIIIENIDRFDIEVDDDIAQLCYEHKLKPETYNLIPNIKTLQSMCINGVFADIKTFIKNNTHIIPNEQCVINACKRSNIALLEYLVKNGAVFTFQCLIKLSGTSRARSSIAVNLFAPVYKKQSDELEKLKKEILIKDNIINASQKSSTNKTSQEINIDKNINVNIDDKKLKKEILIKDNIINASQKSSTNKTSQEINIDKNINVNIDDKILTIVVPKSITIPKRQRQKVNPPQQLVKYLKLNNDKLSFIESRLLILKKIKNEKWFGKTKTLINLPADFRKILQIDIDGFINFTDLDKIVKLCYRK
jgi:hypothetical protein